MTASRRLPPDVRRRSLDAACANGFFWGAGDGLASVSLISYFAREFHASATAYAWIMATPSLAALLRLTAGAWIHLVRSRRRFTLTLFGMSASSLAAMALLATPRATPTPLATLTMMILCWGAFQSLEYIAAVALWSWLGDLAPGAVRGAFLGRREGWLNAGRAAGGGMAAAIMWFWLKRCRDLGTQQDAWIGYAVCVLGGAALFALALAPLARMAEPASSATRAAIAPWRELVQPLRDPRFRRFLRFGIWFSAANGLFLSVRRPLEMAAISLTEKKLLDAASRGAQSIMMPAAGRYADARGNRPLLAASQAIIAMAPLCFILLGAGGAQLIADHRGWILAAYVCWLAYAAQNVVQPNLMIGLSRPPATASYIAMWFAANQLAVTAGIFLGAELLRWHLSGALATHRSAIVAAVYPAAVGFGCPLAAPTLIAGLGGTTYPERSLTPLLVAAAVLQMATVWWALRVPEPDDGPGSSSPLKKRAGEGNRTLA